MKKIKGTPGYLIYFDRHRVDHLVESYDCVTSVRGAIASASITMLYAPIMDRYMTPDGTYGIDTTTGQYEDGIANMINVKIFERNLFNRKYYLVFSGSIRGKSYSDNGNKKSVVYLATGHAETTHRTVSPLAKPALGTAMYEETNFKLKAKGLNADDMVTLISSGDSVMKDTDLREMVSIVLSQVLANNSIYNDADGVTFWENIHRRIHIMGDISDKTLESDILDLALSNDTLVADSVYVTLNSIISKVTFEFFESKDGVLQIKPPFWNQPILKNHVIDPTIMINFTESTRHDAKYSRVIASGALTTAQQSQRLDSFGRALVLPMGVYNGIAWADIYPQEQQARETRMESEPALPYIADTFDVLKEWTYDGEVTIFNKKPGGGDQTSYVFGADDELITVAGAGNSVIHVGWPGRVVAIGSTPAVAGSKTVSQLYSSNDLTSETDRTISIELTDGPYEEWIVTYHLIHLDYNPATMWKVKDIINPGDIVGTCGSISETYAVRSSVYGMSIKNPDYDRQVNYLKQFYSSNGVYASGYDGLSRAEIESEIQKTINPQSYFEDIAYRSDSISAYQEAQVPIDELTEPTAYERKYGANVYDVVQPIITSDNRYDLATGTIKEALEGYAKYFHRMVNSAAKTATLTVECSPQLRAGFNIWVDPAGRNEIYYVTEINRRGGASGMSTTLRLEHGRNADAFFQYSSGRMFGALNGHDDNLFINKIIYGVYKFAPATQIIGNSVAMKEVQDRAIAYHQDTYADEIVEASLSPYHLNLYGYEDAERSMPGIFVGRDVAEAKQFAAYQRLSENTSTSTFSVGKYKSYPSLADTNMSGSYTLDEVTGKMNAAYARTPRTVATRQSRLKTVIAKAAEQIKEQYSEGK